MSEAAHDLRPEFWTPGKQSASEAAAALPAHRMQATTCEQCGTDFILGARFCHVCGWEREPLMGHRGGKWSEMLDFIRMREALGLNTGSLIALIAGVMCMVAAVATGFIFSAATVLDWQAVQLWRIEWLLAAIAAFLAGVLLKKFS